MLFVMHSQTDCKRQVSSINFLVLTWGIVVNVCMNTFDSQGSQRHSQWLWLFSHYSLFSLSYELSMFSSRVNWTYSLWCGCCEKLLCCLIFSRWMRSERLHPAIRIPAAAIVAGRLSHGGGGWSTGRVWQDFFPFPVCFITNVSGLILRN